MVNIEFFGFPITSLVNSAVPFVCSTFAKDDKELIMTGLLGFSSNDNI